MVRQATLDRMREYGIRGSAVTYGTIVKAGVKTMGDMDRMQKNAGFTVGLAVFLLWVSWARTRMIHDNLGKI